MLATFNLQLSMLDVSADTAEFQQIPPPDGTMQSGEFADLLRLRAAEGAGIEAIPGEALPAGGNPLPLPDVAVTVDGVTLSGSGETDWPLLPVADESPWTSLVVPPGLDVRDAASLERATGSRLTGEPAPASADASGLTDIDAAVRSGPMRTTPDLTMAIDAAEFGPEGHAGSRDPRLAAVAYAALGRDAHRRELATAQPSANIPDADTIRAGVIDPAAGTAATSREPVSLIDESANTARPLWPATGPHSPTSNPQPGRVFGPGVALLAPGDSAFGSALQSAATDLIETPVRETGWGERVGERVVMMANNQLKTAEIRLTPAELGPLRVQVNVDDGHAHVTFQAQHAITREVLEQALPRLREMFAESGLSLGQTSVGDQNVAGNRDGDARGEPLTAGSDAESITSDDTPPDEVGLTRRREGLLDTFV